MQDSKNLYSSKGIELQTIPSDKCPFGKCDGNGLLNYINWPLKVQAMTEPHIFYADPNNRKARIEWCDKCECMEYREDLGKISAAGIPEKFKETVIQDFKIDIYSTPVYQRAAQLAKTIAQRFVDKFEQLASEGKGLYFYSETKGSGKTRLASSVANELIRTHKQSVLFIKAADIALQVRKTYKKNSETSEEEILKTFFQIPVLIIDDLAVSTEKEFAEDLLGKIFDHRMDANLITIITSNRTIEDLGIYYPKEIIKSRVKKMCYEVIMPEEAIRDEEAKQDNLRFENLLLKDN